MGALEEELYEDLAYEEAEGATAMEDELEMEDLGMDEDEYEESFEADAYEDDEFSEGDVMDDLEAAEDYYEEFDELEAFDEFEEGYDEAEEVLDDVIPFTREHRRAILAGARVLVGGGVPADLPPRHLVSASHYALAQGAQASALSDLVIRQLSDPTAAPRGSALYALASAA